MATRAIADVPEIPQPVLMVESSNLKKPELYMLNEAEFIRTFGCLD
jgi:hypothetical protein